MSFRESTSYLLEVAKCLSDLCVLWDYLDVTFWGVDCFSCFYEGSRWRGLFEFIFFEENKCPLI